MIFFFSILQFLEINNDSEENKKMTKFFIDCNLLTTLTSLIKYFFSNFHIKYLILEQKTQK